MASNNAKGQMFLASKIIAKRFGKTAAIFLEKVRYYCDQDKGGLYYGGQRWVYNSSEEWADQFDVSRRTIGRIIKVLRDDGVLLVRKLSHNKYDQTNFYSVDNSRLDQILREGIIPKKSQSSGTRRPHRASQDVPMILHIQPERHHITAREEDAPLAQPQVVSSEIINISEEKEKAVVLDASITVIDAHNLFNEIVCCKRRDVEKGDVKPIPLDKETSRLWGAAIKHKFGNSLEKTREYCEKIASSRWLMSAKKFPDLSLSWFLRYSTIDKILNGKFGVRDNTKVMAAAIKISVNDAVDEFKNHIRSIKESERCKNIRCLIAEKINNHNYNSWFKNVSLLEENGCIVMQSPNNFFYDRINLMFGDVLNAFGLKWE